MSWPMVRDAEASTDATQNSPIAASTTFLRPSTSARRP